MFCKDDDNVYRSTLLSSIPWIRHGFGSSASPTWPGEYIRVKQIHSDRVLTADENGCAGEADALVLTRPGYLVGVRTADCVPLLIVDPTTHSVAAVHAGWRGTASNIAHRAVEALAATGANPADLLVAIGPCIGACCFEVGPEVAQQFEAIFPEQTPGRHVDLAEANRRQLVQAGVRPEHIDVSGLCTKCTPGEFESYRRDREASGRMVAAIGIR